MADGLFWLLILMLALVWLSRRRRASERDEPPKPPRLGYQRLEGRLLSLHDAIRGRTGVSGTAWTALSLEDLPQEERRRLVVHIAVDTARVHLRQLERLVWTLASVVQERAAAHAVVIEAFARPESTSDDGGEGEVRGGGRAFDGPPGGGLLRLVFAPDGRGWSGEEPVIAAVAGTEIEPRTFSLTQTHQQLLATLDDGDGDG